MRKFSVLLALFMFVGVANADMWYQNVASPGTAGNWSDLSNWYTDAACTINATALPESGTRTWNAAVSGDYNAATTDIWLQTMEATSWDGWVQQTTNVLADGGICNDMYFGGVHFTNTVFNVGDATHNVTFTVTDELTPGKTHYSSAVFNVAAGSTVNVGDDYKHYKTYRSITNIAGDLIVNDSIELRGQSGWAFDNYLGDIYYDFGDGEKTHVNADGEYPKDHDQSTFNILDGGYVEAGRIIFNQTYEPYSYVNIYGDGLLVLRGAQKAQAYADRAAGYYTGDGVTGGVAIEYDGTNTYIYVPEPATMMLLGLGAFGLIRRKRS